MKSQRLLLTYTVRIFCVVGCVALAQGQGRNLTFNSAMSLEETLAWLSKQLTYQHSVASPDSKYVRRLGGNLGKAKGCKLSYTSTIRTDGGDSASPGYEIREVWALDLSGLDPTKVMTDKSSQVVHFSAVDSSPDAIRSTVFRNEKVSASGKKGAGYFQVPEKVSTVEVAAGLKHAIELCRQKEQ